MDRLLECTPAPRHAAITDCWSRIGVRGDSSCLELVEHVHCRNCPVYTRAAASQLEAAPPADYLAHWTQQVAQVKTLADRDTHSALLFRIGAEWLALSADVLKEIASLRAIHSLPHRRDGVVLGLTNIRGELQVCVSLPRILGIAPLAAPKPEGHRAPDPRFLVIEREGSCAVCPVDEIHGIVRCQPKDLLPVPATVAKASATYTRALWVWKNQSAGLLDEQLLFHTINRSLA